MKIKKITDKIDRLLTKVSFWFLAKKEIKLARILVNHKINKYKPVKFLFPDTNRYYTLFLCTEKILENKISGHLAELGVYQADFSREISLLLPDKDIYLFDTFDGFDDKQLAYDVSNFSTQNKSFVSSEDIVLNKMPYPNRCIVKKGVFPDTARDVKTSFCLVSIDADLYTPTLAGLNFFYPNLVNGGFIFVHDYNNKNWPGVKKAVDKFINKMKINFVPIPDANGTIIITK